jgi:pantothenate kinase
MFSQPVRESVTIAVDAGGTLAKFVLNSRGQRSRLASAAAGFALLFWRTP